MKSKNIPEDIRSKSVKEAQNEINEIIKRLESADVNLENSINEYNRMMQLNNHIREQFRLKAKEINNLHLNKKKKKTIKT